MSIFGSQAAWNVGNASMKDFGPQSFNFGGSGGWQSQLDPITTTAGGPGLLSDSMPQLNMDGATKVDIPKMGGTGLTGWDKGRLAIGGLQTLGNLYMAFQANNLAKKQFNFQRDFANANLAQSIKQYNTTLEDRIRSRAVTEGRDAGYADSYLEKNRLQDTRVGGK